MNQSSEHVGPYQKVRRIGIGAAAEVWLCRKGGVEYAVKVLQPKEADGGTPDSMERFAREARAAADCAHERIVRTVEADLDATPPYIVMEYLAGGSVRSLVEGGDPHPPEGVVEIGVDATAGIAAAHAQGIIHRDVKPENLLRDVSGRVKVADLGLARLSSVCEQAITNSGVMVGTPYYVSPEQARDAKRATKVSDVYSLGATLFHLATGRPVYKEDSPIQTVMCHLNSPPVDPREINPDLPAGLSAVIIKAMEKDPRFRYQSMVDMREDLLLLQKHGPDYDRLSADVLDHSSASLRSVKPGSSPVPLIVAFIAAAILIAVLLLYLF